MRTIELEKFKFCVQVGVIPELSESHFKDYVKRVTWSFLSEKQEPIKVSFPESWWQMFKKQYFPKWALKRWPVKEVVEKELSVRTVYPLLKTSVPLDHIGNRVMILVNDRRIGCFDPFTMPKSPNEWYTDVKREPDYFYKFQDHVCPLCKRSLEDDLL